MHASGESASTVAATLGVSRATVYRVLAEQGDEAHADIGGWWHLLKLRCYIAVVSATTPGSRGILGCPPNLIQRNALSADAA